MVTVRCPAEPPEISDEPCDDCPLWFGEWGAWRAGLAETMEAARHYDEMGNLKRIARAINTVCAAGWSP